MPALPATSIGMPSWIRLSRDVQCRTQTGSRLQIGNRLLRLVVRLSLLRLLARLDRGFDHIELSLELANDRFLRFGIGGWAGGPILDLALELEDTHVLVCARGRAAANRRNARNRHSPT